MRTHVDDRRLFYGALFDAAGLPGDLNVVVLQPRALIAWHRHQHQTDFIFCIKGSVKVGKQVELHDTPTFTVLHERNPESVIVPPNTWHGYMNLLDEESILLSYCTQHFNPDDEERRPPYVNDWLPSPR